MAYNHQRARRYDEAIAQYQSILELHPDFRMASYQLAQTYTLKGMHAEALEEFQRLGGEWLTDHDSYLGFLYARMGRRDDARRILDNLARASTQEYVDPWYSARVYAGLGDNDQAIAWLEKAYQNRSAMLAQLKVEGFFDPLRSDPRFQDLVARMGFPEH